MGVTVPCAVVSAPSGGNTGGSTSGTGGTGGTSSGSGSSTSDNSSGSSTGTSSSPSGGSTSSNSSPAAEDTKPSVSVPVTAKVADTTSDVVSAPFNAVDKVVGGLIGTPKDPVTGKPKAFAQQSLTRRLIVAIGTSSLLGIMLFFGSRLLKRFSLNLWSGHFHHALATGQMVKGQGGSIIGPNKR